VRPFFNIETVAGEGNLSANSYFASIVGPRRIALGSRQSFALQNDVPVNLINNTGVIRGVCFVSVSLVPGQPATLVLFGSDASASDDSGVPEVLSTAATGVLRFQATLNPGEALYAALPSTTAPNTTVNLVVSTEWY